MARIFTDQGVTASLTRGGAAISEPVTIRQWEDADGVMRATASFGPYVDPVVLDGVLVEVAGDAKQMRALKSGGVFTLPAGMAWDYVLTLSASIEQV